MNKHNSHTFLFPMYNCSSHEFEYLISLIVILKFYYQLLLQILNDILLIRSHLFEWFVFLFCSIPPVIWMQNSESISSLYSTFVFYNWPKWFRGNFSLEFSESSSSLESVIVVLFISLLLLAISNKRHFNSIF